MAFNPIDAVVTFFSPVQGLKRAQARKIMRAYQGAESNRLTNNKKPKNQSANQELGGAFGADAARAWARALVRDNAYAWGVVDTIVSSTVGCGIMAQSMVETEAGDDIENVNLARDKKFSEWAEVCDINGGLNLYEMQALAQREIVEAGEVLVRFVRTPGKIHKGIQRPFPLALELIEADRLASEKDTRSLHVNDGNRIVRGVEVDDTGKPVAYWIHKNHPNDIWSWTPERVPAKDVLHLFRKDRVGQNRGITWFAPVMSWLRDLGIYVDNEIQSSAVASCFGIVIKGAMPVPGLLAPSGEDSVDTNGNTLEYLEPGMITRIAPGEDIETVNPGRPNSGAEPWINLMLRGIAVGTGLSYEIVARDYSKTSYSSSRTSQLEDRRRFRTWQRYLVNNLCMPIWDEVCNAAALAGDGDFPRSSDLLDDRRKFAPVEWQTPAWEWVDPQSEQTAAQSAIANYMSTLQDELGSRGKNYRQVLYQAAKEKQLRRELGLLTPEEIQATAKVEAASQSASGGESASGEWMGLSRMQWNRNRKALQDVLDGLSSKSMSPAMAKTQLLMIGLSDANADAVIADATDGTVTNPLPTEEVPQ